MNNKELIIKALEAKKMAHVPYSSFHVGAALITEDDKIYSGCNIETASYSPTICAERTAIFKAVSEGHKKIKAIAVVGDANPTFPCGVCRQVIREFGRDAKIIIANTPVGPLIWKREPPKIATTKLAIIAVYIP